jgi:hypothetical protein
MRNFCAEKKERKKERKNGSEMDETRIVETHPE